MKANDDHQPKEEARRAGIIYPFAPKAETETGDGELVGRATGGDRRALEQLLKKHHLWIHNIILRMTGRPDDAEDVTQEVMIKITTKLSTFKRKSAFRTWVYRIIVNHLINMKKKQAEERYSSFAGYGKEIDESGDLDPPDPKTIPADLALLINETRQLCMMGMLLCLNRAHRIVFILADILGTDSALGSAIMGITRTAFRKKLSRARRQLANFTENRCGLIGKDNPCVCARKTRALIESGAIDPENLQFNSNFVHRVRDIVPRRMENLGTIIETKCGAMFRDSPLRNPRDIAESLRALFESREFNTIFTFQ